MTKQPPETRDPVEPEMIFLPLDGETATNDVPLIDENGVAYDIPVEGSLGLLAMGYTGIMLWREKRYGSTNS